MYWSAIRLFELDSVLHALIRTMVPVSHAFELCKHAFKFVALREVIFGDQQVFWLVCFRIIVRFLYGAVPIYLLVVSVPWQFIPDVF